MLFLFGCSAAQRTELKKSKPVIANDEYQKLLLGNLSADYVGNENCLKGCHTHDKLALDFKSSTMGDQLAKSSSGMMIVDCESCHGPASVAVDAMAGLDAVKDNEQIRKIHKENFLRFDELPGAANSLICLKCHTTNATFNIHNWNASAHALSEVTCKDCHPVHGGTNLITDPRAIVALCLKCHVEVSAEFSLPSHHPVKENKLFCTDCHDPHGNANPKMLRKMTVKETCGRCHAEKTGPFLYEHGDITEDCTNCHRHHGSINENLLKLRQPFLCKQCHEGHRATAPDANPTLELAGKNQRFNRCTDCHSMVHGSDAPSGGGSNRGRLIR